MDILKRILGISGWKTIVGKALIEFAPKMPEEIQPWAIMVGNVLFPIGIIHKGEKALPFLAGLVKKGVK